MVNETIFLLQIITIVISCLIALRLGKEALIALIVLQAILANLFISKEISLFSMCITCTDAYAVGAGFALNLLQEYYGKTITKRTIWISFFILLFYLVMSQFQLWYYPLSPTAHHHFVFILSIMPRLIGASVVTYIISQYIDYSVYKTLKRRFHNRLFILRNYGSLIISQTVDTILFSSLGLYGVMHNIGHIIAMSLIIKFLTIILGAPLISLLRSYVKSTSSDTNSINHKK